MAEELPQPSEPSDDLPDPSEDKTVDDKPSPSELQQETNPDPEVSEDKPSNNQAVEKDTTNDNLTETPSTENNDEIDKKEKEEEEDKKEEADTDEQDQSNDNPAQEYSGGDGDVENKEEPQQQAPKPEPGTDEQSTTDDQAVTEEGVPEISQEEKDIHTEINKEKEVITKCIDNVVESMSKFENDSQEKTNLINETFDSLIKSLNDRRNVLINELKDNVLTTKSDVLKQLESLKQYEQRLNDMDSKYQSLINPNSANDNVNNIYLT